MSNVKPPLLVRSELCTLAGISIERFKYLARHEKLPIVAGYNQLEGAARSWRAYSAEDVVTLALFAQATGAGGLNLDDALYAVGNGFIKLKPIADQIQSKRPSDDIWIVAALHKEDFKSTFAGTLADLSRYIADNELQSREDSIASEIGQIWAINASMEFRAIVRRASIDRGDLLMRFLESFRDAVLKDL
jgi:hypothetical protein